MKKKVVQLNGGFHGSTGFIMKNISECAENDNWISYVSGPKSRSDKYLYENVILCGSLIGKKINQFFSYQTGNENFLSFIDTFFYVLKLKRINPDIIHLHNIHGNYLNTSILFKYLKKSKKKVVWTLHDCWTITGHCPYFDMVDCKNWANSCGQCPQLNIYPESRKDKTEKNLLKKKKLFTSIATQLTIITPSIWLKQVIESSYWKSTGCQIKCIHNGIDLTVFYPRTRNLKKEMNMNDKVILLGVATGWITRKGIDVFNKLVDFLPERFQIILVGTKPENIVMNSKILLYGRTKTQNELAELYSSADIFINPTREEVFGMVNIEALACGTPVITFNTGGSPETIDETCGAVVEKDNIPLLCEKILEYETKRPNKDQCLKRAAIFDMNQSLSEYVKLYNELIK